MKGKEIIGLYIFEEGVDNWTELEENIIIELNSGFLISEVKMSPFGTGAAGIHVFTSRKELENKYEQKLKKLH